MTAKPWTALLLLAHLAACAGPVQPPAGPGPVGAASGRWRAQAHWVPARDADGTPRLLYAQVCRPEGAAPARVAVLNHGTGPDRPVLQPAACDSEAAEWFLRRGYLVVAPVRRGYGATGGAWGENLARGGRGGSVGGNIGSVCHADRLVEGAGRFGATAGATPMLWLYASNDHFFSPDLGRAMHRAFTAAGGRAEFVETGISGFDGHGSFRGFGGSQRWGPLLERYLAQQLGTGSA